MALAETTLSAAAGISDKVLTVASATSFAADRVVRIDGEIMQVSKEYVAASTSVPVLRGRLGTIQAAHVATTRVVHGAPGDFGTGVSSAPYSPGGRVRRILSYSTTATLALPAPGEDLLVVLNSTAFTLTVPVPTLDLDGCEVTFTSAAGTAHVLEFTGGLGGASTSYETVTFNATGAVFYKVVAYNETWRGPLAAAFSSGTSTNIAGTIG